MKNILIISDMVGAGNIGATAMMPVLSYMGFPVSNLPTSLVSNNFGYDRYAMLDTTAYLRRTLPIWKDLGFGFDAIATGFIPTAEQASLIADFCASQKEKGAFIVVDPVMGDLGQLYKGLDPETMTAAMRRMLSVADVCLPNYTEACLLTGTPYKEEGTDLEGIHVITGRLLEAGAESVVITSARVDGKPAVAGFDAADGKEFLLEYEELPLFFSGTGDTFSAILMGHMLKGESLPGSCRRAIDGIYNLIRLNKDSEDPYKGLPVEKYLSIL